jgi:4'-phosphopantetheinyl transferase
VLIIHQVTLDAAVLTAARRAWLSPDEEARAARMHRESVAARWRVAHVALRAVLAPVVSVAPSEVRFAADATGRPVLDHPAAPQFSLSHAGDQALIAVGGTAPLGVDLELVRPVAELDDIARTHFASEEHATLVDAREPERTQRFFRIWTRKEAYLKAIGVGVGPRLPRVAVSADARDARLLRDDDAPDAPRQWSVCDLALATPYVGALAVRSLEARWQLVQWRP